MGLELSDMLRSRRGNAAAALAAIFAFSAAWGSCQTRSSKSMIMETGLRIGSSVGRSSSQQCWKASNLCENMRDYIDRNGLTHIFVGTSSKTGGSTTKHFFSPGPCVGLECDPHFLKVMSARCQWAITGSHMWRGLKPLLNESCSRKTLFLLPVREEVSWMRSALKQVCWHLGWEAGRNSCEPKTCPKTCGNQTWLQEALRLKPDELRFGPHKWIAEWMVRSQEFHTFLFDYSVTEDVLRCLPPKGLRIENLSRLARHVYRRDDPIESANNAESDHLFRPVINISDHAMLAGYNAPYWVQPYATAAKASDCAVASALGLQVVKR